MSEGVLYLLLIYGIVCAFLPKFADFIGFI